MNWAEHLKKNSGFPEIVVNHKKTKPVFQLLNTLKKTWWQKCQKKRGGYKIKKKMLNCAPTLYIPSLCPLVRNSSYFCTERRDIGIQEVRTTTIDPTLQHWFTSVGRGLSNSKSGVVLSRLSGLLKEWACTSRNITLIQICWKGAK